MTSQVFWYAARAGGIVAWALAAASVVGTCPVHPRARAPAAPGRAVRPAPAWPCSCLLLGGGYAQPARTPDGQEAMILVADQVPGWAEQDA